MKEVDQQTKWISKFNIGDNVRHVSDECEKGIITGVLFESGNKAQYKVSNGNAERWWYEIEVIKQSRAKK